MLYNYFNFAPFREKYLITNDCGEFLFLTAEEFARLTERQVQMDSSLYQRLYERHFVYEGDKQVFIEETGAKLREYRGNLFGAPSLHIFVVTKRCNQNCIYCQASAENGGELDMDCATGLRAARIALDAPTDHITIEFQGGEPLLNFPVIREIVEFAEQNRGNKQVDYTIVTNLTLLNEEMLEFIADNKISISTSLDGDERVHNRNRPIVGMNPLAILKEKLQALRGRGISVSAIQTTTRYSLPYFREIVDIYRELDFDTIFLRPLTKLGYASQNWENIGYSTEEFISFYRNAFRYILECNLKGYSLSEGHASIFLSKIIKQRSMNYMELRSPCGGGFGQIAYYYNGEIYTCDEARMLGEMGDQSFRLGHVEEDTFYSIMQKPVRGLIGRASCLESLPLCAECVFMPYCGVCPVINWAEYGTVFPQMKGNDRCQIYKGIQTVLFDLLYEGNEEIYRVLESMAQ